jgi:hypothetical protein
MALDAAVIEAYATTRGHVRATTDHQQDDVRARDLDSPTIQAYVRRRADVEAAWYISGVEGIAVADQQEAERVFSDAFVAAYQDTARRLG